MHYKETNKKHTHAFNMNRMSTESGEVNIRSSLNGIEKSEGEVLNGNNGGSITSAIAMNNNNIPRNNSPHNDILLNRFFKSGYYHK